jgi:hypothetical protein
VAWTALAIVSSNWVWDFGNNVARAFAPIMVLCALSICRDVSVPEQLDLTSPGS